MLSDLDTFEVAGLTFRLDIESDDFGHMPWDESDGHGPVSDWERRAKLPGERVLVEDRGAKRFYDVKGALALAKKDGWGLGEQELTILRAQLNREPTRGEILARAVERDFDYLRRFCQGHWEYVYVVVTLLDVDGRDTPERESVGGIESESYDYIEETAKELAEEIARRIGDKVELTESRTWTIREVSS